MSTAKQSDHYVAPYDDGVSFDELPDSAPSSRYKPSWTGWLGISIVGFWVFIAAEKLHDGGPRHLACQ